MSDHAVEMILDWIWNHWFLGFVTFLACEVILWCREHIK